MFIDLDKYDDCSLWIKMFTNFSKMLFVFDTRSDLHILYSFDVLSYSESFEIGRRM